MRVERKEKWIEVIKQRNIAPIDTEVTVKVKASNFRTYSQVRVIFHLVKRM